MLNLNHAALLLLAAPALLGVAWAARRNERDLPRGRRAASLLLRSLAVVLLTLVLARPSADVRSEPPACTIFLVDVSDSVPRRALREALLELRAAWDRALAAGRPCGLVAFAGRAQALQPPALRPLEVQPWRLDPRGALEAGSASAADVGRWMEEIATGATDHGRAIAAARALQPEGAEVRLVLVGDGCDTVRPAREIDLPPELRAVRLHDPARRDAAVLDVAAPLTARAGEPFDVRAAVRLPAGAQASVSLFVDGRAAQTRTLRAAGPEPVAAVFENLQQDRPLQPGLCRIDVTVELAGDEEPRNNLRTTGVTVTGKPRVLLVEGAPAEGEALAGMMAAQDIEFVRESPAQTAARRGPLEDFVAVVLAGVPLPDLPPRLVDGLKGAVEASGRGLFVVGSPALEGPRGYARSGLEALLPVTFSDRPASGAAAAKDPPPKPPPPAPAPAAGPPGPAQRVLAPSVAILFLVDKSGSMAGRPIQLVKEAVLASAEALTPRDFIGVLAFDARPRWLFHFTEAERRELIRDQVLRLFADGGTAILPALAEAQREFQEDPRARRAALRHVVLLSDGDTQPADHEPLVRQMARDGITLTTVCVPGRGFNPTLMSQLAEWGGGRFVFAESFQEVPAIFVNEVRRVLAAIPKPAAPPPPAPQPEPAGAPQPPPKPEDPPKPLRVAVKDPHEVLQGIDGAALPPVYGLLESAARPDATVPLAAAEGRPLLALRRAGLGKTAVWTSDLAGRWGRDWVSRPGSGKLFAQLLRHVSSAAPDAELAVRVRRGPGALRVEPGSAGETLSAEVPETRTALAAARRPDGGISFVVPAGARSVLLRRGDGASLQVAIPPAPVPEFARDGTEGDVFASGLPASEWRELDREPAGARMADRRIDLTPWLIAAAVFVLTLDVAVRRYSA